ncbi:MAG: TssQ family T6SS-associated lipoprotein [Pseudomonadota bacterium]
MQGTRRTLILMGATLLLSACAGTGDTGLFRPSPAEQKLRDGIHSYEEGEYKASLNELQAALTLGLKKRSNQVLAHKYLAFIQCVSGRERQCRDEFSKVLEIDPGFELKPAEAGHPTWGPVFRSVKVKYTTAP